VEFAKENYQVATLVDQFDRGLVVPNPEYQRGLQWDANQMKSLIDSLFRKYPLPPIFLHEKTSKGLRGEESSKFEIVDGQQRIRSLVKFRKNEFELLETKDKRLKIPNSLRGMKAPWQGLTYDKLPADLQTVFDEHMLEAYCITGAVNDDEVRDLFIRLQAGKPLTPQQVRDAWPGPIGPFVEQLAGKLDRVPSLTLFEKIDRRGSKEEEATDKRVNHRVICAQLLLLYMERSRHPDNYCAISSKNLDQLYHENTTFRRNSEEGEKFIELLRKTERVVEYLEGYSGKGKFRRLDIVGLFCFLHDISYMDNIRIENSHLQKIAEVVHELSGMPLGKSTSLAAVQAAANALRERAQKEDDLMIKLDPKRAFSDSQKQKIREKQDSKCDVCKKAVLNNDEEFDHYPMAYARGGKTEVSNGRLVHRRCHPRHGRIPD